MPAKLSSDVTLTWVKTNHGNNADEIRRDDMMMLGAGQIGDSCDALSIVVLSIVVRGCGCSCDSWL